jgi:membrane-associated protease RseP (regulator of RpoE activity)
MSKGAAVIMALLFGLFGCASGIIIGGATGYLAAGGTADIPGVGPVAVIEEADRPAQEAERPPDEAAEPEDSDAEEPGAEERPEAELPFGLNLPQAGFLGVTVRSVDSQLAAERDLPVESGAMITAVESDRPADHAGLQVDDIIVAVDEVEVNSDEDLRRAVGDHEPGDEVEITYYRNGESQTTRAVLGRWPLQFRLPFDPRDLDGDLLRRPPLVTPTPGSSQ